MWLVSADRFSSAICCALREVRPEECSECPGSMMKSVQAHLLMAFQNMLPLFPPVAHSAHLVESTAPAGSRKTGLSTEADLFIHFSLCCL